MADDPADVTGVVARGLPESPRAGGTAQRLQWLCARAEVGQAEVQELQELLDVGADPNVGDSFERVPLSLLCMSAGHVEAAKALLAAGAFSSSPDAWGRTSLHWCCDRGWLTIAELLLARGAPVNACTKQGDTPLLWAAKSGHVKLVELLLKSGADPLLRNNRDQAALDVAVDEVVRTLISSAAVREKRSATSTGTAPDDAQTGTPKPSVQDSTDKPPVVVVVSRDSDATPTTPTTSMTVAESGSRALAGLPMGAAQVGTSGGPLFSAYKKQPMSSTAGSGSGPGPKKMKITLKKK